MKQAFIFFLSFFIYQSGLSQECTISGNAGTYSGDIIKVYKYSDYITKTKKLITEFPVDSNGSFSFNIKSQEPFQILIDLDVFVGKIVIEPGKKFKIVLPRKTVRSDGDIMNPYFVPMEFYVRILNDDNCINSGLRILSSMYDESVKIIFKDPRHINSGLVEKEISNIDEKINHITNEFFINYKEYKFLHLRQLSYYKNKKAVIRNKFSSKDILYENPAYNLLLKDAFGTFLFETNGDTLYKIMGTSKDWKVLNKFLAKNELYYNKDFREYMLMLNLSVLFHKERSYQRSILRIFQTAQNSNINDHTLQAIKNFMKKSGNLIQGTRVSSFTLYDQNKQQISLSDFKGKFVYLCFFSKDSYTCQKDLILLDQFHKKEIDLLQIITIYKDPSHQNIIDLAKNNKYNWPILHCYDSDKILKDYDVVAYPTYYLIHPKGTLSLLPAPGPSENFEAEYFKAYQEWKRKQIRENN